MRWRDDAGNDHIGTPLKFASEPAKIDATLPKIGENTLDILDKLDLTPAQRREILESLK
jgi:crotonobetainyl-CoA:carnitine CoA-transferase CaiB-like acyl-CoA transferase